MSSSGCPVWQRLNRAASRALALVCNVMCGKLGKSTSAWSKSLTETAAPQMPAARDCLALKWVSASPCCLLLHLTRRRVGTEQAKWLFLPMSNGNTLEIKKKQNLSSAQQKTRGNIYAIMEPCEPPTGRPRDLRSVSAIVLPGHTQWRANLFAAKRSRCQVYKMK